MEKNILNNQVTLCGEAISNIVYSHELYGEKFYKFNLCVLRSSGVGDVVKVIVSDMLIKQKENIIGKTIAVSGQIRTHNRPAEDKKKLDVFVFALDIEFDSLGNENSVYLLGTICKSAVYRQTPLGREITDVLIAVNRAYKKSDYIPCICWGRYARYISEFEVGEHIEVFGRIQSREYVKKLDDGTQETRTAYEVSVSRIDVVKESECEK